MFGFSKKKGPTLGLDINGDSITLINLDKTRAGIEVVRFGCQPTPPNAIREGLIADPETVGAVVLDLLNTARIPPQGPSPVVNIAVPAQAVVIRLMPVPTGMPPEELADVVTQEATNHVPFPIEDANLDWSPMPASERTDADGVRRIDIILAAIQRSIIESYWRMADSAGVRLGRVDISSLAVVRSLALAGYLGSSGHLSMIVNIRHDATDINMVRSAMPLFGRSIMLGVDTLTEAISRSLDLNFDQALDMLPEIPLYGQRVLDHQIGQAAQVARTVFGDITDELVRSLEFYKSQVGDVKVDQILLSGPGCMVPDLTEFISSRMGIKTVLADPMRDLVFNPEVIVDSLRPILAALIGTAIEPSWNPSFTVDLDLNKEGRLPLAYDERKTAVISDELKPSGWFKAVLLAGVLTFFATLGALAYIRVVDLPGKAAQVKSISDEMTLARKQVSSLASLRISNTVLSGKKKILDRIVKHSSKWASVLDDIGKSTPHNAQLAAIIFADDQVKVEGAASDFSAISDFALRLADSPYLKEPTIEWAARSEKEPDLVAFKVTCAVAEPTSFALKDGKPAITSDSGSALPLTR